MSDKKTYYHTCPLCGANLDPGEKCDCDKKEKSIDDYPGVLGGEKKDDTEE